MNYLTDERLMSTSEVAGVLGVNRDTVNETVKRLNLNGVLRQDFILRNNQGGYMFNEEQVTAIKLEIQKHHNLATRQIDTVSTELEENMMIQNAINILARRNNELQLRVEEAEKTNALLMHSNKTYTPTEIAKELNLPVRGFKEFLSKEGYIYYQNGAWLPYYGKENLFVNKQSLKNGLSIYTLHITQAGREKLLKKYKGA